MLKRVVLALVLMVSAVQAETIVIRNDGGGNINAYRARRAELARADQVEIREKCLSACVIFTTLPNACIGPHAKIGFHGTTPKSGIPQIDLWLDMRMGEYFRGEAKRLFVEEWRNLQGKNAFHVISAKEYKRLDPEIRICKAKKK